MKWKPTRQEYDQLRYERMCGRNWLDIAKSRGLLSIRGIRLRAKKLEALFGAELPKIKRYDKRNYAGDYARITAMRDEGIPWRLIAQALRLRTENSARVHYHRCKQHHYCTKALRLQKVRKN